MKPVFVAFLMAIIAATPADARSWSRSWAVAPQMASANRPIPDLEDRTIRQVVRVSLGGRRLRLRLTNEMSEVALLIGSVTVAVAGEDGKIVPGTVRRVTFSGQAGVAIAEHAPRLSDPVDLEVLPLERLAVSIYLPQGGKSPTVHSHAAATAWIAPGDQTNETVLRDPVRFGQRLIIGGVDVDTVRPSRVVVAFGDSITDGARATENADTRWPDQLATRLQRAGLKDVGVANMGIGGNRLLKDGTGPNALARFDRDVLSVPGVRDVIVLEGVNDIGSAWRDKDPAPPTTSDIINAYRQLITRAHDRGVRVHLATILPYKGATYWSEPGEAVRQQVNAWIRANPEADGVVDFDRAVRDPDDPARLAKAYDGGDALHPNDTGFKAMADAIPLGRLK